MPDTLRYVFGLLGVFSMIGLVLIDKVYTTGQPVPANAYLIVGGFIVGSLVGADNLTKLITSLISRFIGNGK